MKYKYMFEMLGRLGIVLGIAITMSKTQWYQDFPFQTLSNASFSVWVFSLALVLGLYWIGIPLMKEEVQE